MERLRASQTYLVIPEEAQDLPSEGPERGDQFWYIQAEKPGFADRECRQRAVHQDVEERIPNFQLLPAISSLLTTSVALAKDTTRKDYWLTFLEENTPQTIPTRIAGGEVHIVPVSYSPAAIIAIFACRSTNIRRMINPRRFLTEGDIAVVRGMWPTSVGLRVYITGYVIVLFPSRKEMEASWKESWANQVGGLQLGGDFVDDVQPSEMSSGNSARCLGLRVRFQDGTDAVTALSHAFVRNPGRYWILGGLRQGVIEAKGKIWSLISQHHSQNNAFQNSPLGKPFPSNSPSSSSRVTKSYDTPSPTRPYPNGYTHDLSLLTGPVLPHITTPHSLGTITGWANYAAALDGAPLFETRLRASASGKDIAQTANAIVEGTEYFWDAEGRVSAALMWRTDAADSPRSSSSTERGHSNKTASILCLGQPGDRDIKVGAFRNYTFPVRMGAQDQIKHCSWRMRGGFVLPEEVRGSKLV